MMFSMKSSTPFSIIFVFEVDPNNQQITTNVASSLNSCIRILDSVVKH